MPIWQAWLLVAATILAAALSSLLTHQVRLNRCIFRRGDNFLF